MREPIRDLWAVYRNEWMKLMRRRRLWITIALSVLVLAGLTYLSWNEHQNMSEWSSPEGMQRQLEQAKEEVRSLQAQLKQTDLPQEEREALEEQLGYMEEQHLVYLEEMITEQKELVGPNWDRVLTKEMKEIEQMAAEEGMEDNDDYVGRMTRLNEYHLDNDIRPLQDWEGKAFQSTSQTLMITSMVFLPMLVVILVADMVSGETTSGTIKLLLVRPVSRLTVLLGKWLTALTATTVLTLTFCAFLIGIHLLLFGVSDALQGQLVGVTYTFEQQINQEGSMMVAIPDFSNAQVIPAYQYFLGSTALLILSMIAVATIAFFTSTLFQSAMVSTGIAFATVIIGSIMMQTISSGKWIFWLFSIYLYPADLWTGQLSLSMEFPLSMELGLGVLAAWTALSILLAAVIFQRRDVLQA